MLVSLLTVLILPFLGAFGAGIFGRFIGQNGAKIITVLFLWVAVLCLTSIITEIQFKNQISFVLNLGHWIQSGLMTVQWTFALDFLTKSMLTVVLLVSGLVHIYAGDYMATDAHIARFMAYLSMFTLFMLILVTGDNFLILFLGWEGVGLCSYLLISFWYTRIAANKSAIKALLVNRVSDFGFTLGLLALFFTVRTLDFSAVFPAVCFFTNVDIIFLGIQINGLSLVAFLLFTGAMGKSAQLGLHTWLPDAMEGPTPVSALIHAATMVTAGVFLVIKSSPIFEYTPTILSIITFVGAITAFFAATAGLVQSDIKKVIAYSTCSQLGYMFFICGLSGYHIGLFHLANHAFFKALLFLSAGAIIHCLGNEQDMRKYGGLLHSLPFTAVMLLIGSLSLAGVPFLTGYYSKDLIIEFAFAKFSILGLFSLLLGSTTAFITAFYSLRVLFLSFLLYPATPRISVKNVHESSLALLLPLACLSLGSIFFGYLLKDFCVGIGTDNWNGVVFIAPQNNSFVETEFVPILVKFAPFILGLLALLVINVIYNNSRAANFCTLLLFYSPVNNLFRFLSNKWEFDGVYNRLINLSILRFSYDTTFKELDKGLIEYYGPLAFAQAALYCGKSLNEEQSGRVYNYAWFIVIIWTMITALFYIML